MSRKTMTEEDFGLAPTDEEIAGTMVDPVEEQAETAAPEVETPVEPEKPVEPAAKTEEQPRMVDIRALQEARAEAREARERANLLEQRWNEFISLQRPAKEPEKPVPSEEEDPYATIKWLREQVSDIRSSRQQESEEQAKAREAQEAERALVAEAAAEFSQAVQSDASVKQAYEALISSLQREAAVYQMPPHVLQQHLARTEMQHIAFARQNRIPLASYIKGLATARGWQPQTEQAAPAAPAAPAAKTDVAAIAAAQQRHQSLSDAPGGEAVPPLDAKALAKMSDKEFKAWMSKRGNEQKFDEIMGA